MAEEFQTTAPPMLAVAAVRSSSIKYHIAGSSLNPPSSTKRRIQPLRGCEQCRALPDEDVEVCFSLSKRLQCRQPLKQKVVFVEAAPTATRSFRAALLVSNLTQAVTRPRFTTFFVCTADIDRVASKLSFHRLGCFVTPMPSARCFQQAPFPYVVSRVDA